MKKKIKIPTKVGLEIVLSTNALLLFGCYDVIMKNDWQGSIIMLPIVIVLNYFFFSIKYEIENNELIIKTSLFWTKKIDVFTISKIEKTGNLLSSPAPSIFGRIEIYFEKDSIVISPKDYYLLKSELLKINPNILFKE